MLAKTNDPEFYPKETKERRKKQIHEPEEQAKQQHIQECNTWAKKYYSLGCNVIPIQYKSKKPNISSWKEYQHERIPEKTFNEWIQKNKFENLAIIGGHISQDIVCFDIDNPQDFIDLKLKPESLINDGAWVTETPKEKGRYHLVIRDNKELTTNRLEKHIDYRANEVYWLAYPSIHPNGKQYNFLNTKKPEELILPSQRNTLAIFEKWNDVLNQKKGTTKTIQETTQSKEDFDNSPDCIRNAFKLGASPGMRYYVAQALGSYLQQQKFPLEMAEKLIIDWFQTKCDTSNRPIKDIKRAAQLGYQKNKYSTGCSFWRNKTTFCPYKDKTDCNFYNPKKENVLIINDEPLEEEINSTVIEPEVEDESQKILGERSFLGYFLRYINKCTNADPKFAVHMGLHLLGIAVGVNTTHRIQPKPIHHNTYVLLLGSSTTARKTTVQDLAMNLASQDMMLPTDFSPEGFLQDLEKTPQGVAPLGEISSLLRSIKNGGYMSKFKEIQNELHGCPPVYSRRLAKKSNSVTIKDPYVNLNSTCTPEEFFSNLDDNLLYGGTLARWILVDGKAEYRPRSKLAAETLEEERLLRRVLRNVEHLFNIDSPIDGTPILPWVEFEFTDDGLDEFNKIDRELMMNTKWRDIQPFVGRYLNYLIVYSDLLVLSDLIGAYGLDEFTKLIQLHDLEINTNKQLHYFNNLNNLNNFNNFTHANNSHDIVSPNSSPVKNHVGELREASEVVKLLKLFKKPAFQQKRNNFTFYVSKAYVQRAFAILVPSLNFAKKVTRYVNEDLKIARLKTVFEKHAPLDRSRALRYSKLSKKDFDEALETLIEREEVFQFEVAPVSKRAHPKRVYCLVESRNSKKCQKCRYKGCNRGE